jgi:hypothetical protein
MKTVGTTWFFKKKDNPNANIVFKARLCAQRFSQNLDVDFDKTFALTGCINSLRSLISYVASKNLDLQQLDFKTAFLNSNLEEEVFLSIPQGVDEDKRQKCLRLNKAIYGLKQAPLSWYNHLSSWLISFGFRLAAANPCVFYWINDNPVRLFIHVNDIAVFGKDLNIFRREIKDKFDMKALGADDLLLGIKILHEPTAIILSQAYYVNSLLDLYGMINCCPVSTPLVSNSHLTLASDEVSASVMPRASTV